MGRKTQSNIKYLSGRGAVRDWYAKCRLLVATSGIQGSRGVSHHLTQKATSLYNQWSNITHTVSFLYFEHPLPRISSVF